MYKDLGAFTVVVTGYHIYNKPEERGNSQPLKPATRAEFEATLDVEIPLS